MIVNLSKMKGVLWLVLTIFIVASFATSFNSLISLIPWSVERGLYSILGHDLDSQICTGEKTIQAEPLMKIIEERLKIVDGSSNQYNFDIEFLQKNEINAFAGLAGHIFVYKGLIDETKTPEEFAGVLAHEIEHVKRRHILQAVVTKLITSAFTNSSIFSFFSTMQFSKKQEVEADKYALERLDAGEIDTLGLQHFFERMAQTKSSSTLLSDHPSDSDRAEAIQKHQSKNIKPLLTADQWTLLKEVCR